MPAPDCLLQRCSVAKVLAAVVDQRWLGEQESTRLAAMSSPWRRRQFLAGHWLTRQLACERFGGQPGEWQWRVDQHSRPELRRAGRCVQVSLSHSGDEIVCGVSEQAIGIDLELSPRQRDWLALSGYMLSPQEQQQLQLLPEDAQRPLFLSFWSLKEAAAKRNGRGLAPSVARGSYPRECQAVEAQAISWWLGAGSLALAMPEGTHIELRGLDDVVNARYWRFESSSFDPPAASRHR